MSSLRGTRSVRGKDGANHFSHVASSVHRADLDEDEFAESSRKR